FLEFSMESGTLNDLVSENPWPIKGHKLELSCRPGQCMLFELPVEL
ncbi:MAG: hypothetical protein HGA59_10665, partial [Chlorobiaceae bacterium]|nr:hypothetical protein [Chlorobiaceae bacterium]